MATSSNTKTNTPAPAVNKFNPNTGQPLKAGESVQVGNTGTYVTEGKVGTTTKSPVISNQSNITQSSITERAKYNDTAAKIDGALTKPTGVYGTPVYDVSGKLIGTEKYDINTGKPLAIPQEKTQPEANIQDAVGNKYYSSMPEDMTYQLPGLSNDKKWVFDASGKAYEMDSTGKITSNTLADQEYNANKQYKEELQQRNEIFDRMKENLDASHQLIVERIKATAEKSKRDTAELNSRILAAKKVAGFRTGGTEYTPELAMGILKNEEESGIRRIQEIDDKMVLALAEAVTAKDDKDLAMAQSKFETFNTLKKNKQTEIQNLYKTYLDTQKYISDTNKALLTEKRAAEDQAMQKLKAGSDAYLKGYNSAKDKNTYINSIATKFGIEPEIVLGEILNAQPKAKTSSSGGKQTITEIKSNAIGEMATGMQNISGSDGYIDPNKWIEARKLWSSKGLNDADFLKNFKQYLNPSAYNLIPEFKTKKSTTSGGKTS